MEWLAANEEQTFEFGISCIFPATVLKWAGSNTMRILEDEMADMDDTQCYAYYKILPMASKCSYLEYS